MYVQLKVIHCRPIAYITPHEVIDTNTYLYIRLLGLVHTAYVPVVLLAGHVQLLCQPPGLLLDEQEVQGLLQSGTLLHHHRLDQDLHHQVHLLGVGYVQECGHQPGGFPFYQSQWKLNN